jgi:hypothetical protein
MIAGEILDAFPEERSRGVALVRVRECFAMQSALFAFDVQRDHANEIAFGSGDQLKLSEMLFEVEYLETGTFPEELQAGQIIHIGPADDALRRIHGTKK